MVHSSNKLSVQIQFYSFDGFLPQYGRTLHSIQLLDASFRKALAQLNSDAKTSFDEEFEDIKFVILVCLDWSQYSWTELIFQSRWKTQRPQLGHSVIRRGLHLFCGVWSLLQYVIEKVTTSSFTLLEKTLKLISQDYYTYSSKR